MNDESGIETLRALVSMANYTREDAFDGFNVHETIKLLQACRAMDLETLPDELTEPEARYAAKTGRVSRTAMRRLYRAEYGARGDQEFEGSLDDRRDAVAAAARRKR
jgi:hypothetical protein